MAARRPESRRPDVPMIGLREDHPPGNARIIPRRLAVYSGPRAYGLLQGGGNSSSQPMRPERFTGMHGTMQFKHAVRATERWVVGKKERR